MHLAYKQTSSGPNPEFPTRAFAQINKRKVIKMEEYLFDLEDYFYHDDNLCDFEHFSETGYPSQDDYVENPDVIYYSNYEYPF